MCVAFRITREHKLVHGPKIRNLFQSLSSKSHNSPVLALGIGVVSVHLYPGAVWRDAKAPVVLMGRRSTLVLLKKKFTFVAGMKRVVSIVMMLLASMMILGHSIVPHHHHDQVPVALVHLHDGAVLRLQSLSASLSPVFGFAVLTRCGSSRIGARSGGCR